MLRLFGNGCDQARAVTLVIAQAVNVDLVVRAIGVDLKINHRPAVNAEIVGKTLNIMGYSGLAQAKSAVLSPTPPTSHTL